MGPNFDNLGKKLDEVFKEMQEEMENPEKRLAKIVDITEDSQYKLKRLLKKAMEKKDEACDDCAITHMLDTIERKHYDGIMIGLGMGICMSPDRPMQAPGLLGLLMPNGDHMAFEFLKHLAAKNEFFNPKTLSSNAFDTREWGLENPNREKPEDSE